MSWGTVAAPYSLDGVGADSVASAATVPSYTPGLTPVGVGKPLRPTGKGNWNVSAIAIGLGARDSQTWLSSNFIGLVVGERRLTKALLIRDVLSA